MGTMLNTLESHYYTSDAVFREEVERIFYTRWTCVGRADHIPRPGDYFIQSIGDESLIIVRDRAGQVHAHYNVCRHRGTRMCTTERGRFSGSIQCPYHAWTYGLDGRLIGAPNMNEVPGFEKCDYPLYTANLETW